MSALTHGAGMGAVSKDSWWRGGQCCRDSCPCSAHCARPQPPSTPSPAELPANVKQAYRTFAAVPGLHPPLDTPAQVGGGQPSGAPLSAPVKV